METTVTGKKKRPLGVTIALWGILISGLLNLLGGLALLLSSETVQSGIPQELVVDGEVDGFFTDEGELLFGGIAGIIIGVGVLAISIGFWRCRRWAWVSAMTWLVIGLLVDLVQSFVSQTDVFTFVLSIVLIFVLNHAEVRHAFGIERSTNDPPPAPIGTLDVN